MDKYSRFFEVNKDLWDKKTPIHKQSKFYDLEGFLQGRSSLHSTELEEVGDVAGKSMLHLMCHFGMDTLSWARMGARVTGVDFSGEAIELARSLGKELGIEADFICSNVYDLQEKLHEKFDIVYMSYGVLCWLPDLDRLAQVVARFLKPGGMFYVVDFHPVLWMFDDYVREIKYSYFSTGQVIEEEAVGTYADHNSTFTHLEYYWTHDLSELINALIRNNIRILKLNEFPYASNPAFRGSVLGEDGKWRLEHFKDMIPLMFSVKGLLES